MKKNLVLGIVAHVDAGKTTLAESMLFLSGSIKKTGRVDHGDAFLDTYELEKSRGITIFSKQALFELPSSQVTLLDTPGHVDFSAEMERTLQVMDYCILVLSWSDGVSGHVLALWKLLAEYHIPVFVFVNKMDQPGADRGQILNMLQTKLDAACLDFGKGAFGEDCSHAWEDPDIAEQIAMCDDDLLEEFLENQALGTKSVASLVKSRRLFPCFFGSALKIDGVEELLDNIDTLAEEPEYGDAFGAKVFKIARDAQGTRLTYMKITGGSLKVKDLLRGSCRYDESAQGDDAGKTWEEKADQLRKYSGAGYSLGKEALAGQVVAVTGLTQTWVGEGLGAEEDSRPPFLEPVLSYRVGFLNRDEHYMYRRLKAIEEEEPQLHVVWQEPPGEIRVKVMGEVQIDVLKNLIWERLKEEAQFSAGSIIYKETIENTVEGIGHFEPLRHYAEVHLRLEPGERGSGLVFDTDLSEDILARNWQRLILTHLEEKQHKGVLTGSELTDVKITLVNGRAHLKHTEGGDFRQATYRAVRQGLMQAKSLLLEPVYSYRLCVPSESVGRAMNDLQQMNADFTLAEEDGGMSVLTGKASVLAMRDYQRAVTSYTKGQGSLYTEPAGYEPCHNAQEVLAASRYNPEQDLENTPDSVFCSHGAGFIVPWYEVPDYMHLDYSSSEVRETGEEETQARFIEQYREPERTRLEYEAENEELKAIFERTKGPAKVYREEEEEFAARKVVKAQKPYKGKPFPGEEVLLVDGYNIIFAWDELKETAKKDLAAARQQLMDILSDYQGIRGIHLILVFDAYRVAGGKGSIGKYHNIHVIYTKEAETADQYIEKTVHEIGRKYRVTVATSDSLEQVIILGQGAVRMSASGLLGEVRAGRREIRERSENAPMAGRAYLLQSMGEDVRKLLEREDKEE